MRNKNDDKVSWLSIGMCIGASLGVVMGYSTDNMGPCLCVGLAVGIAVGLLIDRKNRKDGD